MATRGVTYPCNTFIAGIRTEVRCGGGCTCNRLIGFSNRNGFYNRKLFLISIIVSIQRKGFFKIVIKLIFREGFDLFETDTFRLTCGTYAEPYLYGYSGGGVGK